MKQASVLEDWEKAYKPPIVKPHNHPEDFDDFEFEDFDDPINWDGKNNWPEDREKDE